MAACERRRDGELTDQNRCHASRFAVRGGDQLLRVDAHRFHGIAHHAALAVVPNAPNEGHSRDPKLCSHHSLVGSLAAAALGELGSEQCLPRSREAGGVRAQVGIAASHSTGEARPASTGACSRSVGLPNRSSDPTNLARGSPAAHNDNSALRAFFAGASSLDCGHCSRPQCCLGLVRARGECRLARWPALSTPVCQPLIAASRAPSLGRPLSSSRCRGKLTQTRRCRSWQGSRLGHGCLTGFWAPAHSGKCGAVRRPRQSVGPAAARGRESCWVAVTRPAHHPVRRVGRGQRSIPSRVPKANG